MLGELLLQAQLIGLSIRVPSGIIGDCRADFTANKALGCEVRSQDHLDKGLLLKVKLEQVAVRARVLPSCPLVRMTRLRAVVIFRLQLIVGGLHSVLRKIAAVLSGQIAS